jgi:hypothetical protein
MKVVFWPVSLVAKHSGMREGCVTSITGRQAGELLGWDNLTADKPSAETVIVYRRASTSMYTELSSMFAPCRKYI